MGTSQPNVKLNELPGIHGVLAEFGSPEDLIDAAKSAYTKGYRRMDAYTPLPVEGLAEAIGYKKNYVALVALIGGICGASGGFGFLYWISVIAYAHNVGGRPYNSWPAYIPISFECMILFSALSAVIGMMLMNGLPSPYHPVFNVSRFSRASVDKFFLCIESSDPKFGVNETQDFLKEIGGIEVAVVPA